MSQNEPSLVASSSSSSPSEARPSVWALVREALAGSHRDLTSENLGRAIILLAVPMVLEMVMESIFAIVDIFWVSKLGPDAVASVGITESMLTVVYASAMGLSMAATAVVARRMGEKQPELAARAAVQAVAIGLVLAAIVGTLGVVLAPHLLGVMGASPEAIAAGSGFTRTMLGGSVTIVLLFLLNAVFRGAGDAAIAMRTLWLANGLNIVLGPLFVFGLGPFPKLGVMGAAVATTIGRGIGVLYQLRAITRKGGRLTVTRAHVAIDRELLGTILRIARSGVVQVMIGMSSWLVLVRILAGFGSQVLAGYTISMRVIMFALLPSWGMGGAAATLVGQNLGAGRPDRADQAVWRAGMYNVVFLGVVGLALVAFAARVMGLFSTDPVVIEHGTRALRIIGAGFPFYAYGMVVVQAFNGAGDTRTPTLVNLVCFWAFELPVAWLLAHALGIGPTGAFIAIVLAFTSEAVLAVYLFRRGTWRTQKV